MASYRIVWEIECVDAKNPQKAAEIAKDCVSNGTAQQFYVQDENTDELVSVDLLEPIDSQVTAVTVFHPIIHSIG
jgi:hypothetical protein